MLKAHFDAQENVLLATSKIPANTGHTLHKGTPRENFIRLFLEAHLSEKVAIGTGEIIDCNSKPNEPRNQIDIIIYKREFPKLDFGGGVYGFLAESVVATIEVKSVLDSSAMTQSINTAKNIKSLCRNQSKTLMTIGYQPPGILSYVVAYDGPASMRTVAGWLPSIHKNLGIILPELPLDPRQRSSSPNPSIDGVFLLGRGFLIFDNCPVGFSNEIHRKKFPKMHWGSADTPDGNLLLLFIILTTAVSGTNVTSFNSGAYLKNFNIDNYSVW